MLLAGRVLPEGHPFVIKTDGSLAMPEAPPRLKRNNFQSDELFQAATAQRELESRERRKWSEWLRDQRRDRTGRARPSEDARRLTPVAKRAKSEANKAARDERSKERRTVYEADRRARIEAREAPRRAARVEMWARITARQTDERAAFLAKAATRVTERAEREAAAAVREKDAAPFPKFYQPAPKWWTEAGKSQQFWCQSLDQLRDERVAAQANAASGIHVDCVRCGQLFQRSSSDDIRCPTCRMDLAELDREPVPEPESEPEPEPEPSSDHESDDDPFASAVHDYPCYDPIDRTEGAYFSSLVYRDEAEREAFLD